MSSLAQTWEWLRGRASSASQGTRAAFPRAREGGGDRRPAIDVAAEDPLLEYLLDSASVVDVSSIPIDSPARAELQRRDIALVVPMVSQGELVGLLGLGPRLGDRHYTRDDKRLLASLAAQAAPALRVAQLVSEHKLQVEARAHIEQELGVARAIQQFFLPRTLPEAPGWEISAHYGPARAVGGDFYDFIPLPENRLGLVIGDVADKGVPAALVMAATRSVIRASAQRLIDPGDVLRRVNDLLVPDTPPHIYITCLYAVLDLSSGRVRFANAGHAPPYLHTGAGGAVRLVARGVPLGVMPGSTYTAHEACIEPDDHLAFYSDGLLEARNQAREMFGFDRIRSIVADHTGSARALVSVLLSEVEAFAGPEWDQEDDVTLVTLKRAPLGLLAQFTVERKLGQERRALTRVNEAIASVGLSSDQLDRLRSATAEAIINAIEYADAARPDAPVWVRIYASGNALRVIVSSPLGRSDAVPEIPLPDLEAKLEGRESPRGWGLFLMRHLSDDMQLVTNDDEYCVELRFSVSS